MVTPNLSNQLTNPFYCSKFKRITFPCHDNVGEIGIGNVSNPAKTYNLATLVCYSISV